MTRLALHTVAAALCLIAVGAQSASAAPPTILSTAVSKVGLEAATLGAEIISGGLESFYRFEYGPEDLL